MPETAAPQEAAGGSRIVKWLWWTLRFLLALFLFIGALQLMKTGARGLDMLRPGGLLVKNPVTTLGLGWLGALFVLSGSPIAATALALVKAGEDAAAEGLVHFTEIQGFTMLTGSRLGAAFVVLVTAVIYALRGGEGERLKPVSTAVIALTTTTMVYVPAAFLGYALLTWEPFAELNLQFPAAFGDVIGFVYDPLIARVAGLPGWALFLGGLGVLLLSFRLLDTVMPQLTDEEIERHRVGMLRRKWPMFALGSFVALIVMSVSVALSILVPLVAKGYAKRENIVPYIMGANITTLGDTLLAGLALHSPGAVRIVVAQVISTTVLSVLVLWLRYWETRKIIWRFQNWVVKPGDHMRMALFTAALFVVPLSLIFIGGLFG